MSTTNVNTIMTREVVTLREEDNLEGLAESMDKLHYRYLPVVDDGRFVGLITYRSLLRPTEHGSWQPDTHDAAGHEWEARSFVADVMTREVKTLPPDASAASAARLFMRDDVPCIPVVGDDHSLVGIVTRDDVLRLTLNLLEGRAAARYELNERSG